MPNAGCSAGWWSGKRNVTNKKLRKRNVTNKKKKSDQQIWGLTNIF
jgi:hypothetical protein